MDQTPMQQGEILLYNNDGEKEFVSVVFRDETFWLTQKAMAELFDVNVPAISKHLQNIYEEEELTRDATVSKMETVQEEGSRRVRRILEHYNLDAIIAVGYRVNSKKATRFRQWATKTLKEYITKGFVLNDDMLKNGKPFGRDYFDELLERIREIRASERRAYQKIADVFEQCSYDYDKNSETTKAFYAFVQNKLHFAVTGKTAAELISERATLDSPTMGLTTWKGAPDGKILKSDTLVAKNYLNEKELSHLNRLVTMFIDYAELMAEDEQLMSMEDWLHETDRFLTNNRRKVLEGKGHISREAAVKKVSDIYAQFRKKQDADYISEFDRVMERYFSGRSDGRGRSSRIASRASHSSVASASRLLFRLPGVAARRRNSIAEISFRYSAARHGDSSDQRTAPIFRSSPAICTPERSTVPRACPPA